MCSSAVILGMTLMIVSMPLSVGLLVMFTYAYFISQSWPVNAQQFPFTIAVPGVFFALYTVGLDVRHLVLESRTLGGLGNVWADAERKIYASETAAFFGYLIGVLLLTMLVGQKIAIPVFMALYLLRWGGYGWRVSALYAAGGWLMLVGFYDRVMNLFWHPSWLSDWLPEAVPDWFPIWLII